MNSPVQVTVPELIALKATAAKLPLRLRRRLADQAGAYSSSRKGRGMEFDESRLYQAGDDIRNMDWRVTARTGEAHTKLYREERERPVFVWVDLRPSMFFATRGVFKSVFAARLAALIAWQATQQGDRIGGLLFSDIEHHEIKPGLGKPAVLGLINRLVSHPAWQVSNAGRVINSSEGENFQQAIRRLNRLVRPGSQVFLISDFRGAEACQPEFARLSKHCDVMLMSIHDPLELALPHSGTYRVRADDVRVQIDASDMHTKTRYAETAQAHADWLSDLATRYRMRVVASTTEDDPLTALTRYAH